MLYTGDEIGHEHLGKVMEYKFVLPKPENFLKNLKYAIRFEKSLDELEPEK